MELLTELVPEFLFGIPKEKPEQMPKNPEYASEFCLKYYPKGIFLVIFLIAIPVSVMAYIGNGIAFALLIAVPALILLGLYIFALGFKAAVTIDTLTETTFFLFKKTIRLRDVSCLRIVEYDGDPSVAIALYDRNGKHLTDYCSPMHNFWLLVKTAEHNGIEIRTEKNLTLKQLSHL